MEEEQYFHNWEVLKPLMLAKWSRLRESDFHGVNPVLNDLVEVIHGKYQTLPRQSIVEDLENLAQQILKDF